MEVPHEPRSPNQVDQLEPSQQSEDTDEVTLMSQTMSESSRFGPAELSNPLFASFRSDLGHFGQFFGSGGPKIDKFDWHKVDLRSQDPYR